MRQMSTSEEIYHLCRELGAGAKVSARVVRTHLPDASDGAISGALYRLSNAGFLDLIGKSRLSYVYQVKSDIFDDTKRPRFVCRRKEKLQYSKERTMRSGITRRLHTKRDSQTHLQGLKDRAHTIVEVIFDKLVDLQDIVDEIKSYKSEPPSIVLEDIPDIDLHREIKRRRTKHQQSLQANEEECNGQ